MMRFSCSGNEGEEEFYLNDYMRSTMVVDVRLEDLV